MKTAEREAARKSDLEKIEAAKKAELERIAAEKEKIEAAEQMALEGKQYDFLQSALNNGQLTGNQVHEILMAKARPGISISPTFMTQPRDRPKTMPIKTLM